MANLPKLADMLGGEFHEEPLYAENVTHLTKQEALYVRAAKQLEKEVTQAEMDFFREVHALEIKYQDRFNALHDKVDFHLVAKVKDIKFAACKVYLR